MKIRLLACIGMVGLMSCQVAWAGGNEGLTTGPYAGLHGGVAIPGGGDGFGSRFNTGPSVGAQIGYRLGNIRAEVAFSYLYNGLEDTHLSLNTITAMGNAYYDFHFGSFIVPFVGVGIGWGHFWASGSSLAGTPEDNEFTYQAIAGLNFQVTAKTTVGVRYRYLGWTDGSGNQNIIEAVFNYMV